MNGYFLIKDLNKIGKIEDSVPYIYDDGWIADNKNIIMDRIIGYEADEGIGKTDVMDKIKEISEEEAMKIINN